MRHASDYHAYARTTPVIDAIGSVVAVASVVIGTYALLFLAFASHHGITTVAVQNGLFLLAIAVANVLFEVFRHRAATTAETGAQAFPRRVAKMLDTTATSVNSLLRRARAAFESRLPAAGRERAPFPDSKPERDAVGSFADAIEAGDIDAMVALLTDDA